MASFDPILKTVLDIEKGYQANPGDPGNYLSNSCGKVLIGTNHGIGAMTLEDWLKACPSVQRMKNLTKDEAKEIYRVMFWNRIGGDYINDDIVALKIFDTYINQRSFMQRIVRAALEKQGIVDADNMTLPFSNGSLYAINKANQKKLSQDIAKLRLYWYGVVSQQRGYKTIPLSWVQRCFTGDCNPYYLNADDMDFETCSLYTDEEIMENTDDPYLINDIRRMNNLEARFWWNKNKPALLAIGILLGFGIFLWGYFKITK